MTWEDIVKMQGKDGKLRDERISDIKTGKNTKEARKFEMVRKEIKQMISDVSVEGDFKYSFNDFKRSIKQQFSEILDEIESHIFRRD